MPGILFASNSVSHFPGTTVKNDAWAYDQDRVPYAIYTEPATVATSPLFPASETGETWFHFRVGSKLWYSANLERICEIADNEGNQIATVACRDDGNYGYYISFRAGGQSGSQYKWLPVIENQMRTIDIRILHSGITAKMELYVNEIYVLDLEFTISEDFFPQYLRIGGITGQNSNLQGGYFSEIIVADGDTRNARLDLLRPNAQGTHNDFDGPLASLADDDPTTGMTTTLADQAQTAILSEYSGANNISNIVQVTTTVRGINSPEHLEHLIRMGGLDYVTPEFTIPFSKDFQVTDWRLNPATSQPWAASDLQGAEFGFKSKT